MHCTDLLTRELEQVLEICFTAGWDTEVEYTSPPQGETTGKFRVVRCRRLADKKVLLTVAGEVRGN